MVSQSLRSGILVSLGRSLVIFPALFSLLTVFGCSPPNNNHPGIDVVELATPEQPTDKWSVLIQREAYPFTTPLPPALVSPIDGTYVKFDPKVATPIPCRRCPDYMNEGGIWKLRFDKGTFHIMHLVTGWTGIGSYTVNEDQLVIFNDPKCPDLTGRYNWQLSNDGLTLTTIDDSCAADMRSHNLRQMVWRRCSTMEEGIPAADELLAGCE